MLTQVQSFLHSRQWEFQELDEDTVLTGFTSPLPDGQDHGFPLFIMLVQDTFGDPYVRLVIVPYVEQPPEGYSDDVWLRIAGMNHDMAMLRFAIDADGDLELLVDIPSTQLDQASFNTVMQLLADYAGLRYLDLALHMSGTP